MSQTTVERQNLIEAVNTLPDEALTELAIFVDYLRYKTVRQQRADSPAQPFLLAIAGLGQSGQTNISDTDEEVLQNEIDPIHGWSSKLGNQPCRLDRSERS